MRIETRLFTIETDAEDEEIIEAGAQFVDSCANFIDAISNAGDGGSSANPQDLETEAVSDWATEIQGRADSDICEQCGNDIAMTAFYVREEGEEEGEVQSLCDDCFEEAVKREIDRGNIGHLTHEDVETMDSDKLRGKLQPPG